MFSKECDYDEDDACDHLCTSFDYEDMEDYGATCSHAQFKDQDEVPPLTSLDDYKNINFKRCCEGHAYVFSDSCQVRN